jgi:hypothetical protein
LSFSEDHYSNAPTNRPYSMEPSSRVAQNGNSKGNGVEDVWLRTGEDKTAGKIQNY